jgi:hypothetical protein
MQCAAETPPESTFLIVPRGPWQIDRESEWFPVVAERRSVATVQGMEWVLKPSFESVVDRYDEAWDCGFETTRCLDEWVTDEEITFTHVWVPRDGGGQCCDTLLQSLDGDPRFNVVFDGDGGTIYQVVAPLGLSPDERPTSRRD